MSKLVFWTTQASKKTKGAFLPVKSVETAEVYMSIPWLEQAREWTYILLQQQQQQRGGENLKGKKRRETIIVVVMDSENDPEHLLHEIEE